jgi:Fic family protein
MQITKKQTLEFLVESNAIEGVFDTVSLQQAIYAWDYLMTFNRLNHDIVLKTHKILMLKQKLRPDQKGYFRSQAVWIGGREALPHYAVSSKIGEWLKRMNDTKEIKSYSTEDMEKISKNMHIQYEFIHPFIDGNGRTGRMFMNWWRIQTGLGLLIIKDAEKRAYYDWFINLK